MKSRLILICLAVLTATDLFLLASFSFQSCKSGVNNIDEFINIHKVSNRAIVVSFGYDAVIAITTPEGIVVIDAGTSNSLTAKFRKVIEREFKRSDFVYLINTHSHSDHTGGNQVFNDASIVGHENCLADMPKEWKNPEKVKTRLYKLFKEYERELDTLTPGSEEWKEVFCQKIRYKFAYNDVLSDHVVTLPAITFNDSLDLSLGDVTIQMLYFGKAHSGSDILVHIPELKLLFTGDLFFSGGKCSIRDFNKQDTEQWKIALQWLSFRRNEIEVVVGGHGQIMSREDLEAFAGNIEKKSQNID